MGWFIWGCFIIFLLIYGGLVYGLYCVFIGNLLGILLIVVGVDDIVGWNLLNIFCGIVVVVW